MIFFIFLKLIFKLIYLKYKKIILIKIKIFNFLKKYELSTFPNARSSSPIACKVPLTFVGPFNSEIHVLRKI
jgi:hypothetical protein